MTGRKVRLLRQTLRRGVQPLQVPGEDSDKVKLTKLRECDDSPF